VPRPNHADTVLETVRSPSAASRLAASWRRSLVKRGLNAARTGAPERLTAEALRERRERLDNFMRVAAPRVDQLFGRATLYRRMKRLGLGSDA
jgi:transcriptional regulator of acetoin/glycerol metabolism